MNDGVKKNMPYKPLGSRLKRLRESLRETLAEAAGAVEIDTDVLDRIEQGKHRPTEDILELLINHFSLSETEAESLWRLAGYEEAARDRDDKPESESVTSFVVLPMDTRVTYTDALNVLVNDYGVTLQFMQNGGSTGQPVVVSRLGMSKEHARSMIELLQRTLAQAEPRTLPPHTEK